MERPVQTAARQGTAAAAQAPRQLPPGFRFHPTDEELVVQYLRRKALSRPLPAAVIPVVDDVARLDPWDLPGASEGEGYFFSLRRAPATGRAGGCRRRAGSGYWKATGKASPVFLKQGSGCGGGKRHLVGVKTALAFHRGEPSSSSSRTAWVMHEYRLAVPEQSKNASHGCVVQPGEWVVCRIFLRNRPRRRSRDAVDSQTEGNRAAPPLQHQADAGQLRPLLSPSPSSSSCVTGVTDISDQEEVSSGSSIGGGPAASQREA